MNHIRVKSASRPLSAEILPRAFAPRRATSGLVRIPPASDAYRGESRSLVNKYTPPNLASLQFYPRSRHAGVRCASALRGVAGAATYRYTRSCYTVIQARQLPHSMRQPPRLLAQGEATPVRFSATGCNTRRLSATRLKHRCGFPAHACRKGTADAARLNHYCGLARHRLQDNIRNGCRLGDSARQRKAKHPQSVFPQPLATSDGLARPARITDAGSPRTPAARRTADAARLNHHCGLARHRL